LEGQYPLGGRNDDRGLLGVYAIHDGTSVDGSAAGPRVSYWLADITAALNGL